MAESYLKSDIGPDVGSTQTLGNLPAGWRASRDTLWVQLTAKYFIPSVIARGGVNQGGPVPNGVFRFLMPPNFAYAYNHTWEDFNTIAGAIREVKAGVSQQAGALGATASEIANMSFVDGTSLGQKNDNPYIYQNTERFNVALNVEFSTYRNPVEDVYNPVRALMNMSCPAMQGTSMISTEIQFPFVFDVQTYTGENTPSPILVMADAALNNISATWNAPYINGYPSSASVSLTLTDIYPVYRNSFSARKNIKASVAPGDVKTS